MGKSLTGKESENAVLGCLLALIMVPIFIVGGIALRGYVVSVMWAWFMVPAFELPTLSIPLAIGVSSVAQTMTGGAYTSSSDNKDKDTVDVVVEGIAKVFLAPLFILLFGYIVTLFM